MKKGEKGIPIIAPIVHKKSENNAETEPDESSVAVGFRAACVFDISQTDGQPLPENDTVNGDPRGYRDRLAQFVADQGIALEYSEDIAPEQRDEAHPRDRSRGRRICRVQRNRPRDGIGGARLLNESLEHV